MTTDANLSILSNLSLASRLAIDACLFWLDLSTATFRLEFSPFLDGVEAVLKLQRLGSREDRFTAEVRRSRQSRYQPGGAVRFTSDVKARVATPTRPGRAQLASEGGDSESEGAAKGSLTVPFHKTPSVISHHGPWADACETRERDSFHFSNTIGNNLVSDDWPNHYTSSLLRPISTVLAN